MDHSLPKVGLGRLTTVAALFLALGMVSSVHAATMPAIQPIAVQPIGAAPGNGIATQVTYQIGGSAVNDAGVAAAANEASYVTRGVTMSGGTVGGIIRGGLSGASRFLGWVGLAITAYQVYQWYKDSQTGQLMAPGQNFPAVDCTGGDYWLGGYKVGEQACSLPGIGRVMQADLSAYWGPSGFKIQNMQCVYTGGGTTSAQCNYTFVYPDGTSDPSRFVTAGLHHLAPAGTQDAAYSTSPTPVTDDQLAGLANQHPDWWPQLFTDPLTGNVVVNPDIAHDIDALKQQLAPKYGVDPTTLTPTPTDPNYGTQQSTPKQTDLPAYCGWAAAACDYYQWVEDHWPNKDPNTYSGGDCNVPPGCSGDQVLCGVAQSAWSTKCAVGGDGTQPPDGGQHVVSELDGPDKSVGDASQLDTSGFGFGTQCPFETTDVPFGETMFHMDMGPVCQYGPWLRWFLLALTAWKCGEIVAGLRSYK